MTHRIWCLEWRYWAAHTSTLYTAWCNQFNNNSHCFNKQVRLLLNVHPYQEQTQQQINVVESQLLLQPPAMPNISIHTVKDCVTIFGIKLENYAKTLAVHHLSSRCTTFLTTKEIVDVLGFAPLPFTQAATSVWIIKCTYSLLTVQCNTSLCSGVIPACQKFTCLTTVEEKSLSSYWSISNFRLLSKLTNYVFTMHFVSHTPRPTNCFQPIIRPMPRPLHWDSCALCPLQPSVCRQQA